MDRPGTHHPSDVLIVDDRRMFAESLSCFLLADPAVRGVVIARTKDEATRTFELTRPDFVLVSRDLGDREGLAVVSAIRAIDGEAIIVLTTSSDADQLLIAAVAAGCSGLLTEDQAAEEVTDTIRAAAAGESLISRRQLARIAPGLSRVNDIVLPGHDLTEREQEILRLLATGLTSREIGGLLHLSVNTIRNYVQTILGKLDAHSKMEAVSTAVRLGIIDRLDMAPSHDR